MSDLDQAPTDGIVSAFDGSASFVEADGAYLAHITPIILTLTTGHPANHKRSNRTLDSGGVDVGTGSSSTTPEGRRSERMYEGCSEAHTLPQ